MLIGALYILLNGSNTPPVPPSKTYIDEPLSMEMGYISLGMEMGVSLSIEMGVT